MRRAIGWVALAGAALLAVGSALAGAGCSGEEYVETEPLLCADPDIFKDLVSPYMENRCATLDCHGARARPLRIYSRFGQRHPAEANITGGEPTTLVELEANYAAVCGLEPEKMSESLADFGQSAEKLLIISKPRGTIAHKGGQVMLEGDNADQCILRWLRQDPREEIAKYCVPALEQVQ